MKNKIVTLLFSIMILLTGCQRHSSANIQTLQTPEISLDDVAWSLSDELQITVQELGEQSRTAVTDFVETDLLITDDDIQIYRHQLGSQEFDLVLEMPSCIVGSADSLLMQGRYYYTTGLYVMQEDGIETECRQIIKGDLQTGEKIAVDSRAVTSEDRAFVYLAKLDENHFLSAEINERDSCIKMHDCRDNKVKEFISSSHQRLDGVIQGRIIMDACASDQTIYVLVCMSTPEELTYSIEVYGPDGMLEQTFEIPEFNKLMADSAPLGIWSLGDYILLEDWNFRCLIYHRNGDYLEEVIDPDQEFQFYRGGMDNYYTAQELRYIYLIKDRYKYPGTTLYALDTQTGALKSLNFQDKGQHISSYRTDEYGNMVLNWESPHTSKESKRQSYYLDKNTLEYLLEQADNESILLH